jgi:hypothetical protein
MNEWELVFAVHCLVVEEKLGRELESEEKIVLRSCFFKGAAYGAKLERELNSQKEIK